MKLTYALTIEELAEASLQETLTGGNLKKYMRRKAFFAALIGLCLISVLWMSTHDTLLVEVYATAFGVATLLLGFYKKIHIRALKKYFKKIYASKEAEMHLKNRVLDLTSKGISTQNSESTVHFKWTAFQRFFQTPELIALKTGMNMLVIPKNAFKTKTDEKAALKLIQEHLKQPS